MREFKVCYPDANTIDKVIKLKPINEFNAKYIKLDGDIGYWLSDHPFANDGFNLFRELVATFPIQKDNNHPDNLDPNPFDTIHVPEWVSQNIVNVVEEFYRLHNKIDTFASQIHEWGNVYYKHRSRPITCWRIPHIDYVHGMVANLWFTDHNISDSGTKLYRYKGKMYNEIYDFQKDTNHPRYKEWLAISDSPKRADAWFNIPDEELSTWGFECVGIAPSKEGTMTWYNSNICHLAYISENVEFRWSHAFAFSHETHPQTFGDLLR
ncbi:hypothetical protein UFOVP181_372 [uncultured Caudovirales phage]|uniref:Uncharacterized protein n=1 Tax=uncultured Caudovirales phage TaxID=2100421 RepID=A0A6J7WJA2_9CAUD|nr:hypothetical protein UFOVP57_267 [uncultured Caudovirales phage]CAB5209233.1 hypothetical protein UFOVP181_372 [uncultured Caudovirales phage]